MGVNLHTILMGFVISLVLISHDALAQTKSYKASLANMPQSAEEDKNGNLTGAYVELIKALDRLTKSQTQIDVVPFKRSVRNLVMGNADYHIPLIEVPGEDLEKLPYAFSTATLFQVSFVLYTNKNSPVEVGDLGKYSIGTDLAHTSFFPFPTEGLSCLSCAIQMVDAGRIDGFIFAQNEIDPFIRDLGLKNIKRQLYKNFDVKVILPKGKKGQEIDAYFTNGIKALKERGEYNELLAPVLAPYIEWQP
ncbi:MAG: transporter substrate-binding domain-containing protein [Alphaproteobacteria bacterium]|nr:transporter substrate-binding domain-containing protein [Rhodospirillales bacterium]MCW9044770.1 transporter substrate-binding domain-containing protein [Alphaproteobacteria bacterium]